MLISHISSASVVYPADKPSNMVDIGYGVQLPAERLLTLMPKEYKQLTGHRLGFAKAISLKFAQKQMKKEETTSKSQAVAAVLCFFLGYLGAHRFYLGYPGLGILQLFTAGGLGIWWLIDFIRILTGGLKPKKGEYAKKM